VDLALVEEYNLDLADLALVEERNLVLGLADLVLVEECNLDLADLVLKERNLGLVAMSILIYRVIGLVINTSIDLVVTVLEMTRTNLSVEYYYPKDRLGQL
jgi:hypothetical protein